MQGACVTTTIQVQVFVNSLLWRQLQMSCNFSIFESSEQDCAILQTSEHGWCGIFYHVESTTQGEHSTASQPNICLFTPTDMPLNLSIPVSLLPNNQKGCICCYF